MAVAKILTRAGEGITAPQVRVEVHLANGLPAFHLVGMAETSVKEARERVRSALINSGFEFPARRITVNLAPATIPKYGGRYDLPIALGILAATQVINPASLQQAEFVGELGLTGDMRAVRGLIPVALAARAQKRALYFPQGNRAELDLVDRATHYAAGSLVDIVNHLNGVSPLTSECSDISSPPSEVLPKWDDIIGQSMPKRALTIAAAGSHHLLFVGPPGTGKSLLASRLIDLLPPLSTEEALEVAALYSLKGQAPDLQHMYRRPFRSPHHTSSAVALTGGGTIPTPGEISLAHKGVLFLDELPEFGRKTLDVLREPLETGSIHIARVNAQAQFPAQFQLIAALNPSPTGEVEDGRSTPQQVQRYLSRLSGPLLDRMDLQVEVLRLGEYPIATAKPEGEKDSALRARQAIELARTIQLNRQAKLNHLLCPQELADVCRLSDADLRFLQQAAERLKLSMRAFHRTLKVARTIADLEQSIAVGRVHLSEALSYRALDTLVRQLSSN
ncbi:ATP-dependent protease [Alteromonas aestuariivivens]|uniref:ATP-dependent protease n=1 Tax=Alteromonas aestuariivivens TaxID=1938339 RepID=A0A3D8M5D1_9ALTE|nr:YifB family Mg chelatase-like AAA ATPase [Alteromonas aestuariivivens]RDV24831.1 ATP-dependent protease [Alteromonas aestuariivivens]